MLQYILKFLSYCDLFGKIPSFTIKSSSTFTTIIGSVLTIFSVVFIIVYLLKQTIDVLKHKNVQAIISEIGIDCPPKISFTDDNFIIALSLQYSNYSKFIDESIYTINGHSYTEIRLGDGSLKTIEKELKFIRCNNFPIKVQKEYFNLNDLHNLYCLDTRPENDINLEGVFGKEVWTSFEFNFLKCNNSTSNNTCKSDVEINERLKQGYIGIFQLDYTFDPNNYTYPIQIFGENVFNSYSAEKYSEVWMYYREIEVITNYGYIFGQKRTDSGFKYDYMKVLNDMGEVTDDKFSRIIFGLSQIKNVYERKYTKLGDLAADVGGMAKLCFIIGECLSFFGREFLYRNYILMFFYESNKNPKSSKGSSLIKPKEMKNNFINENLGINENNSRNKLHPENSNKFYSINRRNSYQELSNVQKCKIDNLDISNNQENMQHNQSINVYKNKTRYNLRTDTNQMFPKLKDNPNSISFYKVTGPIISFKKYKLNYGHIICPLICFQNIRKPLSITYYKFKQIEYLFDIVYYLNIINDVKIIKQSFNNDYLNICNKELTFKIPTVDEVNKFKLRIKK